MSNAFSFISTFTGIGGFDLGFENAGMTCIGQCEIDQWANMVLRQHWPDAERVDDVRKITKATFLVPDLICGGFPCQDLSVAGKRAGLAGDRSGLFFEFERIVSEFKPSWFVIENVPGLLSSNEKLDFATVLRRLAECGYLQAYRIFDSQYFGVAQRRRRVFIVGSLGNGRCAQVLFEPESMQGDPAESREKGQRIAATIGHRAKGRGYGDEEMNGNLAISAPITTKPYADHESKENSLVVEAFGGNRTSCPIDVATACNACRTAACRQDFETETFIAHTLTERTRKDGRNIETQDELAYALTNPGSGGRPHSRSIAGTFGVRRLTPKECERLQGFPDDWTRYGVDEDGQAKEISDTQRYKMCGNAVTVSVAEWIAKRIMQAR